MNDGNPVLITRYPLNNPDATAKTTTASSAAQRFQPYCTARIVINIPLAPMIEPTDRSNSPPIINSATATARMPNSAATSR